MFPYLDFRCYFEANGQNHIHFQLIKRFLKRLQFQPDKLVGLLCKFKDLQDLRTQHQDIVALPSLKGGSSHKNRTKKLMK